MKTKTQIDSDIWANLHEYGNAVVKDLESLSNRLTKGNTMKTTRLTPKKILDFPCVQMITLQILDNQLVYIIWIRTSYRFPAPYENAPYLTFFELKHSKFYLENATSLD